MTELRGAFLCFAVIAALATAAQAGTVRWTLSKISFDDGRFADGWFELDEDTGAIRDYEFITSGQSVKIVYKPSALAGICGSGPCAFDLGVSNGGDSSTDNSMRGDFSLRRYQFFGAGGSEIAYFVIAFTPGSEINSKNGIELDGRAVECSKVGDQGFSPDQVCPIETRRVNGGWIEPSRP